MERACSDACLADNSIIPAGGPCSVDLSDSPDLGASLFQVLGVKGLQRQSSCANWSFDEGRPKSCFPHRGLHGGLFHIFIGMVRVPRMRHARFLKDWHITARVGYEKVLDWPPWKEPLPTRAWLTTP